MIPLIKSAMRMLAASILLGFLSVVPGLEWLYEASLVLLGMGAAQSVVATGWMISKKWRGRQEQQELERQEDRLTPPGLLRPVQERWDEFVNAMAAMEVMRTPGHPLLMRTEPAVPEAASPAHLHVRPEDVERMSDPYAHVSLYARSSGEPCDECRWGWPQVDENFRVRHFPGQMDQ